MKSNKRGYNPDEALRLKIDESFNQLEIFIQKLPLNEKGKNYIWQHSFTQFYDSFWGSETGEPTYGIQTEWQLKRFKEQFKENIKQLRIKRMESYSEELDNLPPLAAKDKVSGQLREIKRKQLFAEIGGAKPTEWDEWLHRYLAQEKLFLQESKNETAPPKKKDKQGQSNTFCNSMPLSIPKEHFKVLTTKKSKNGQPFLTNEQFDLFIDRAFCGNTEILKQKINKANREKLLVQSLFYEFYNNYCMDYFSTMQCQDNFIKILTDNFEGWDFQNVKNNFTPKTDKRL